MRWTTLKILIPGVLLCGIFWGARPVRAATFQMQTGYYLGTGTDNFSITGVGFQPELILIKGDAAVGSVGVVWKSSAMSGETSALLADAIADLSADAIQSLDSNGFTLGTHAGVNSANVRYTWVAFRGSDCTSSGTMCVGSYTGDGNATRSLTSVGFQPTLVAIKNSGAVSGTFRTASMPTNVAQIFSSANETADGSVFKTLDTTGFTVGNSNRVNSPSTGYWFFAFKTTAGAFSEGTFTGDGTNNRAITAPGFRPSYVWLKNANATAAVRAEFNLIESNGDYSGAFTNSGNSTNQIKSLDASGFTVGTSAAANETGKTLYWVAFAGTTDPVGSGTYVMKVGTYTGNGTSQSITGVGFNPDLVIIKDQTAATQTVFRTKLMKGDSTAYFANTVANFSGGITALNSDGFSVGSDASVNTNGNTFHYQAFGNAFNPETNTGAADFTIGGYVGNGTDNRDIKRISFQPDLVAIKGNSTGSGMWRTSAETGDASIGFSGVAESTDNIQGFNSDGFQIGTSTRTNGGATTVHYFFAFKASNTFYVNSYTGTGSAQNITSVGFSPNLLWVKSTGTANAVFRPSPLAGNSTLVFPGVAALTDRITGLLSNGFSVGGSQIETNTLSTAYRYAAWKINSTPGVPTLDTPSNSAAGVSVTPVLKTTASDTESDYLRYKIEICTDSGMTANCQTYNQVSSQTGWSGQDAQTNTAYASGTQATYTVQSALLYNTTYYWRSYAIDPGGSNTFGSTQTPNSFTTMGVPDAPSGLSGTALSSTSIQWSFTDNADNETGFYVQDTGNSTVCTASSSSGTGGTVTCTESGLTAGTSYTRRVVAYNGAGNSSPSADATVSTTAAASSAETFHIYLMDPGDKSYTSETRPVFRWKAVTDSAVGIARYDFYDPNGDLALEGIPPSRTDAYETDKYIVKYENFSDSNVDNNYISIQTKSSSSWNTDSASGNSDGIVKEGSHTWSVKAVNHSGTEYSANRTVFVDQTAPTVTANIVEGGQTPSVIGRLTDALKKSKDANPAASGPESVELIFEKKGTLGVYSVHSVTTVRLDTLYWTTDGTEITDNALQYADKTATYTYKTPSLPFGVYRIVVIGRDRAGNAASPIIINLSLLEGSGVVVPPADDISVSTSPAPSVRVLSSPKPAASTAEISVVTSTEPDKISLLGRVVQFFRNLYWGTVDGIRMVAGVVGRGMRIAFSAIGFSARQMASRYDMAAQDAPGMIGIAMRAGESGVSSVGRVVALPFRWIEGATRGFRRNIAMTLDVWFNREPTRITDVRIENISSTSAVVRWSTNTYTSNNKVNFGETLSYGQEAFSKDREKEHTVTLIGLKPNTRYVFEVMSHGKNYVYDSHFEFRTTE